MGKHKKIGQCQTCGRGNINNAFICRRCANELHDLLVGGADADSQPGIVWYVGRLRESAYGQTRLARSLAARSSSTGYALLGNRRAAELLTKINAVLARWEAVVIKLRSTHRHEQGWLHMGEATRDFERLECKRARFVAANVVLLRHHCAEVPLLHRDMLEFAREAWGIINRPNDVCCGPCPTIMNEATKDVPEYPCATLLYAEEGATSVQCPLCHVSHDVGLLREGLKTSVADMMFTRSELVRLMETRLNDRIPQPTFTKLLRDGRLKPRQVSADGTPMFTYNDVCEAREKQPPKMKGHKAS